MTPLRLFIGTYTRDGGKGIYSLTLDPATGDLSAPQLAAETTNPSYIALSPDRSTLYAVSESEAMAAAFRVQTNRAQLIPLSIAQAAGGKAPCHLSVDRTGRVLLVVNYHTGVVASLPIAADGGLLPAVTLIQHHGASVNPERQSSAHAHCVMISPDNRFALVCDLGLDKIFSYRLDETSASLSPAEPPYTLTTPGSGPRHLAFSPDGRHVFVISEMGGTLTAYRYNAEHGRLKETDSKSALPKDFLGENKSAAVRVHPNGRFVYSSNRGPDTICVFKFDPEGSQLSFVENVSAGGKSPRDIGMSPDGKWLVAANQDSNSLTVFSVDAETGRLTPRSGGAKVSMPVCTLFAD